MSIHFFALITDPAQPEYNFFFRFTYLACDCTLWHCQTKPLRLAWHVCGIFSFPYLTQGCILNKQYKNKENLKPNQSFRHSWTSAYVYLFTAATFLHRALYFGLGGDNPCIHSYFNLYTKATSPTATATKTRPNCQNNLSLNNSHLINDWRTPNFSCKRLPNLIYTVRRWCLFLLNVCCTVDTFWFIYANISVFVLHSSLPALTDTSLQRSFLSVPKAAIVSRFDRLSLHLPSVRTSDLTSRTPDAA